jgi:Flp pilus assembly pilin Flp
MKRLLRDEHGAEAVEVALTFPVFLFLILVSMQIAYIGLVRYGVKFVARDVARFLVVHPNTIDSAVLSRAQGDLLVGMDSSHLVSVTASPACPSLVTGVCPGRESGKVVTVSIVFDTTADYFVPNNFALGNFSITLGPSNLTAQVSMVVE